MLSPLCHTKLCQICQDISVARSKQVYMEWLEATVLFLVKRGNLWTFI
jgi:hypothetical protein